MYNVLNDHYSRLGYDAVLHPPLRNPSTYPLGGSWGKTTFFKILYWCQIYSKLCPKLNLKYIEINSCPNMLEWKLMGMVSLGYGIKTKIMFLYIHCFHVSLFCILLSVFVPKANISVTRIKLDWQKNYAEHFTGMQGTKMN